MAATMARLRYAGDMRLVKLKQMAQEASTAHPKRDWVEHKSGGATERCDDDHGDHVRAKVVGDGEPATTMIKTSKQQRIKYCSIKTKP